MSRGLRGRHKAYSSPQLLDISSLDKAVVPVPASGGVLGFALGLVYNRGAMNVPGYLHMDYLPPRLAAFASCSQR